MTMRALIIACDHMLTSANLELCFAGKELSQALRVDDLVSDDGLSSEAQDGIEGLHTTSITQERTDECECICCHCQEPILLNEIMVDCAHCDGKLHYHGCCGIKLRSGIHSERNDINLHVNGVQIPSVEITACSSEQGPMVSSQLYIHKYIYNE